MADLMKAMETIIESVNEDPETKASLLNLKKGIAAKVVDKFEAEQGGLFLSMGKDLVADYLVEEGWTDKIHDKLVEKGLDSLIASAPQLKEIREKLNKAKTEQQLKQLESEILGKSSIEGVPEVFDQASETISEEQISSETPSKQEKNADSAMANASVTTASLQMNANLNVSDVSPEQEKHINAVIQTAQKQIGKPYLRGGVGPVGFDCSGLWNYAFKKQGITFQDRFTAALFSKTDVDIKREQVKVGDFMYRDRKPGSNKHSPIYHIEMVVDKPFMKNGKWYVKTLGSSTDKGVLNTQGNPTEKQGVGYRLREIDNYRHFGRPPYYLQLAQHQAEGKSGELIAANKKVDADTAERLMA